MAPGIKTNNFDLEAHTAKIQNLTLALAFSLPFLGPSPIFRGCGPWAAQACYNWEHNERFNILDVRSIVMPQRNTLRQFCSETASLFLLNHYCCIVVLRPL